MRIAVALPPIRDFYLTPHRLSALGARIVADLCRQRGHEVALFLFPRKERSLTLPLPQEAFHLRPWMVEGEFGPLSFFTRFQHFGPPFEQCARRILEVRPDAILVSSFAYAYAEEAVELARAIKAEDPEALIAVGGAGPSSCPEYYLRQNSAVCKKGKSPHPFQHPRQSPSGQALFDFVVTGEGEVTAPLLLEQLEKRATRSRRGGTQSGETPQLIRADHLCTEKELVAPIGIVKETPDAIWVTTSLSRGCPKRCRFCSNHLCHGREFRTVPIGVFEEALKRIPPKPILHLNFEDDNLLSAPEYFFEVLRVVQSYYPSVRFSAENGLDYLLLDPPTIDRLIRFGFSQFNLSLGTIYPETSSEVDRPLDLSHYLDVIREIHNRGCSSITYFIAGLPGDTPEKMVQQIRFLQPLPTLIGISLFYPVPGIPGFSPPSALLLEHPGLGRGSFAYPWTGSLTTEELITAFRLCRYVNLLKKERRTEEEDSLIHQIQDSRTLLTFQKQVNQHVLHPEQLHPNRTAHDSQKRRSPLWGSGQAAEAWATIDSEEKRRTLLGRNQAAEAWETIETGEKSRTLWGRSQAADARATTDTGERRWILREIPANPEMIKLFFSH